MRSHSALWLQDLPRSDNFVTVRLLDQLKRSDVVFGSTCPRWNQVISLDLHVATRTAIMPIVPLLPLPVIHTCDVLPSR